MHAPGEALRRIFRNTGLMLGGQHLGLTGAGIAALAAMLALRLGQGALLFLPPPSRTIR